ncbi:MAG: hypothetical protein J3Q66DRAFT_398760 [Benniella sp.]|nr:MAG: hypothetical protein J3Q66DRAFT_398760 [Benniella sp.]
MERGCEWNLRTLKEQEAGITHQPLLISLWVNKKEDLKDEAMQSIFSLIPVSVLQSQYTTTLSVTTTILAPQPPPSAPSALADHLHGTFLDCSGELHMEPDHYPEGSPNTRRPLTRLYNQRPRKRVRKAIRNVVTRPPLDDACPSQE